MSEFKKPALHIDHVGQHYSSTTITQSCSYTTLWRKISLPPIASKHTTVPTVYPRHVYPTHYSIVLHTRLNLTLLNYQILSYQLLCRPTSSSLRVYLKYIRSRTCKSEQQSLYICTCKTCERELTAAINRIPGQPYSVLSCQHPTVLDQPDEKC